MKRYIKASFDPSMPDWLRRQDDSNEIAMRHLTNVYALGNAKFYDTPQEGSIPVHLLYELYKSRGEYKNRIKQVVYVPEFNSFYDDIWIEVGNKKYRRLSTAAKSKIAEHIVDTVYMVAPKRHDIVDQRGYVDPRYKKVWNNNNSYDWAYRGQRPLYPYDYRTNKYDKSNPPEGWEIPYPGWSEKKRDKSGYEIPTPEDLYRRLYQRFPDAIQQKVDMAKRVLDEYYDKVDEAKNLIFNQYDIRQGKYVSHTGQTPLYDLNQAIYYYSRLYDSFQSCISEDGNVDAKKLAAFTNGKHDGMDYWTNGIDRFIDGIKKKLGLRN